MLYTRNVKCTSPWARSSPLWSTLSDMPDHQHGRGEWPITEWPSAVGEQAELTQLYSPSGHFTSHHCCSSTFLATSSYHMFCEVARAGAATAAWYTGGDSSSSGTGHVAGAGTATTWPGSEPLPPLLWALVSQSSWHMLWVGAGATAASSMCSDEPELLLHTPAQCRSCCHHGSFLVPWSDSACKEPCGPNLAWGTTFIWHSSSTLWF